MFIELAEHVMCPAAHDARPYCILVPDVMQGRMVETGVIACPACRTEYPIASGVARFGPPANTKALPSSLPVDEVRALLGVDAGGYVVLLGSAAGLHDGLTDPAPGVHAIHVNAPRAAIRESATRMETPRVIPLRDGIATGVVVGGEYVVGAWLEEAVRVLRRGRRLVVAAENVVLPGAAVLASGRGMTLGEKLA